MHMSKALFMFFLGDEDYVREDPLFHNSCSPQLNNRDVLSCHEYFEDVMVILMLGLSSHILKSFVHLVL